MPARRPRHAFTLVELLVVTGIIAVLTALLLPAVGIARKYSGQLACAANLRQWAGLVRQPLLAVEGNEHDGLTVRTSGSGGSNEAHFGLRRRSGCLWLAPG